jgi:hypothetical protein
VVDAKSCARNASSAAVASKSCAESSAAVLPAAAAAKVGTRSSIDDTVFIKSIAAMFAASPQLYSQKGRAWNLSFDNTMASDWLIITPNSPCEPYSEFQMAIRDDAANDFHLKPHQPREPIDPTHPAVELESSVTYPGGPRLNLHAGHSRQIYEEMYKIITTATRCVDIMSLIRKDATPSGQFLAAVRNAITYLSHKPEANSVQIRILLGMPLGWVGQYVQPSGTGPYQHIDDVRNELVMWPAIEHERVRGLHHVTVQRCMEPRQDDRRRRAAGSRRRPQYVGWAIPVGEPRGRCDDEAVRHGGL